MAYGFKASLTIDNTKVGGTSNLSNFPMLVSGTYDGTGDEPDIRTTGNSGNVENTDNSGGISGSLTVPADLAFFSDEDLTNQLDHEFQSYNASTGAIVAWVEVPTVTHDADTDIYMAYGDSDVTTSQEDIAGTWGAYHGVWHLEESGDGTADEFKDSAGSYHLQGRSENVPTQSANGVVENEQDYSSGDGITREGTTDYDGLTELTFECWANLDGLGSGSMFINRHNGTDGASMYLMQYDSGVLRLGVVGSDGNLTLDSDSAVVSTSAGYQHIVAIWRGGNTGELYVDGSEVDSTPATATDPSSTATTTAPLSIGINENNGSWTHQSDGQFDEARISTTALPAGWAQTNYNTMNSPSTFYTVGNESEVVVAGGLSQNAKNGSLNKSSLNRL